MADQISFKTRIKDEAILYSQYYYSYYVMNDYLLISDAFVNSPYYIIRAEKNNYLHLLGVSTPLPATSFFDKCLNGTLEEDDLIHYYETIKNLICDELNSFIISHL